MANDVTLKLRVDPSGATEGVKKAKAEIDDVKKSVADLNGRIGAFGGIAKTAFAVATGTAGAYGLKQAIDGAVESIKADKKLERVLKNRLNTAFNAVQGDVEKISGTLQLAFGYGDEDAKNAIGQLVTSGYSLNGALKQMGMVADVAAESNISLAEAAKVVGLAYQGNLKALREYGVLVKSTGSQTKDAELALTELQKTTQGAANEKALTDPWSKMNDAIGEIGETIGKKLLPQITEATNKATALAVGFNKSGNADKAGGFLSDAMALGGAMWDGASNVLDSASKASPGSIGKLFSFASPIAAQISGLLGMDEKNVDKIPGSASSLLSTFFQETLPTGLGMTPGPDGKNLPSWLERMAPSGINMARFRNWINPTEGNQLALDERLKAKADLDKRVALIGERSSSAYQDAFGFRDELKDRPKTGTANINEMIRIGEAEIAAAKTALPTASTAGKVSPADEARRKELQEKYTKRNLTVRVETASGVHAVMQSS